VPLEGSLVLLAQLAEQIPFGEALSGDLIAAHFLSTGSSGTALMFVTGPARAQSLFGGPGFPRTDDFVIQAQPFGDFAGLQAFGQRQHEDPAVFLADG